MEATDVRVCGRTQDCNLPMFLGLLCIPRGSPLDMSSSSSHDPNIDPGGAQVNDPDPFGLGVDDSTNWTVHVSSFAEQVGFGSGKPKEKRQELPAKLPQKNIKLPQKPSNSRKSRKVLQIVFSRSYLLCFECTWWSLFVIKPGNDDPKKGLFWAHAVHAANQTCDLHSWHLAGIKIMIA